VIIVIRGSPDRLFLWYPPYDRVKKKLPCGR